MTDWSKDDGQASPTGPTGPTGWSWGRFHTLLDGRSGAARAAADAAAAVVPALPAWVGADVERRSLLRAERRAGRGLRWARRRETATASIWTGVAALTPVAAVAYDSWGWLVAGGAALARAALAGRELGLLRRVDGGLPLPRSPEPSPWELRRSAAAEPLRRGEAALAALAAMTRSLGPGPARTLLQTTAAGAADLVDGLRLGAARVVACEAAARAISHPGRRAELARTTEALVATMTTSVAVFDDLLAAAGEAVGTVSSSAPGLIRLREDTEMLRGYAAALRDLAGS
ncbi:phage shock envelope stress response protein PspM [Frankia tisae]|uniref:phage shock envelope stress response protein PspM n=1 Tax=Frankia tisae TaxID=2950104 RepID=UPI0021C0F3D5|nr:hypothetical protein [Frankia tisae]